MEFCNFVGEKCNVFLFSVYIRIERAMDNVTETLTDGLRRQDRQAQQQTLQMFGEMVFSQIARIVTRHEDVEEVYQDVFLKVFRNIATFDARKASLATWVSRIAYHESLNFVQRVERKTLRAEGGVLKVEDISDEDVDLTLQQPDKRTVLLLEKALERLPPEEQALVTMFYYEDRSLKEIAYITDSIPSTVGSQLCRIRKKLYKTIKDMQQ